MKWPRKRWIVLLILVLAGTAAYAFSREDPPDPRYNGAYGLQDGRLAVVVARPGGSLRLIRVDGTSWPLWPAGKDLYPNFHGGLSRSWEKGRGGGGRRP